MKKILDRMRFKKPSQKDAKAEAGQLLQQRIFELGRITYLHEVNKMTAVNAIKEAAAKVEELNRSDVGPGTEKKA